MVRDMLADETARVNRHTRAMMTEYAAWGGRIRHDGTQLLTQGQLLEYANLRMETADGCLLLIENDRIADSLGLSRSLLEHYLLFMLMCRGERYFQLRDLTAEKLSAEQFEDRLRREQIELLELQLLGETDCIEVKPYPRAKDHLMYVFEGMKNEGEPAVVHPVHLVHFQEFRPESLRRKAGNFFQFHGHDFHGHDPEPRRAAAGGATPDARRFQHYLTYDALLHSLEMNRLIDAGATARIGAHDAFLGTFVHPTHDAVQDLHDRNTQRGAGTGIGLGSAYSKASKLLASLYVCHLVAGLLDEAASLVESASPGYVTAPATEDIRALTAQVSREFGYFWFLLNEPPLYDRFRYCVDHATPEEVQQWGGYEHVPAARVPFNPRIYANFQTPLNGIHADLYRYESPLSGTR